MWLQKLSGGRGEGKGNQQRTCTFYSLGRELTAKRRKKKDESLKVSTMIEYQAPALVPTRKPPAISWCIATHEPTDVQHNVEQQALD